MRGLNVRTAQDKRRYCFGISGIISYSCGVPRCNRRRWRCAHVLQRAHASAHLQQHPSASRRLLQRNLVPWLQWPLPAACHRFIAFLSHQHNISRHTNFLWRSSCVRIAQPPTFIHSVQRAWRPLGNAFVSIKTRGRSLRCALHRISCPDVLAGVTRTRRC